MCLCMLSVSRYLVGINHRQPPMCPITNGMFSFVSYYPITKLKLEKGVYISK